MWCHINSAYDAGTIQKMETIGTRIRDARKALGLNQVALAERIGVNQSTVSDIENGALFGADVLMQLSKTLFKSPQFIMTGQETPYELSDVEAKMIAAFRHAHQPKEEKTSPAAEEPSESTAAADRLNAEIRASRTKRSTQRGRK
jgi:transcriptional regulator with XRE-family HTH domain